MKKLLAILTFSLVCFGSVVLAGQNSNSSTTMQPDMHSGSMSGRRHHRRGHRKQRRHRRGRTSNKNTNS
ncbi:MAG TPA: hypothetical protein VGN90_13485 [Pyrinomonadaceae bacterium]|nr:hypothetical protein [Pyrinomonadaceae bacterium]